MLQLKNISKNYNGKTALAHIDMTIHTSDFIGLIGANGAGKSTLMKVILGLIPTYDGTLVWKGEPITRHNQLKMLRDTQALVETPQFFPNLSGLENLRYFQKLSGNYSHARITEALKFVNLDSEKHKSFSHYSMGMKQKLGIANVFSSDCSFIILDEPFNGLDPSAKEEMKQILLKLYDTGRTLLVSSHLLEELSELSTRIIYLSNGKLEKDITWQLDAEKVFEIAIDPLNQQRATHFIDTKAEKYNVTYENDVMTLKIKRESLPLFIRDLMQHKITFYEISDVTKVLKKYFNTQRGLL